MIATYSRILDTNYDCEYIYIFMIIYQDFLRTSFSNSNLSISVRRCLSDTDYRHIQWDTGIPGETTIHSCPTGYRGIFCLAFKIYFCHRK
jgi:hypothetical protein